MTPLEEALWVKARPGAYLYPVDGSDGFFVRVAVEPDGTRVAVHKPHEHCSEDGPHANCLLGVSREFREAIIAHRATR